MTEEQYIKELEKEILLLKEIILLKQIKMDELVEELIEINKNN